MSEKKYYVYLHKYAYGPKAGDVFYVGKGESYRANAITDRGALWLSCAVGAGRVVEIYKDGLTEDCAYTIEEILVAKYRSMGQAEANITNGGSGAFGMKMSDEARAAISRSKRKPIYSSLGDEYPSLTEAVRGMRSIGYDGAVAGNISMSANGHKEYAYDRVWSYSGFPDHTNLRPIILCSNGMKFESQSRAALWLRGNGWPNARTQNIGACIRGEAKTAYGFSWSKEKAPILGA